MKAKFKELENFVTFDVYDVVDAPKDANIIGTEWVLVEKENIKTNKMETRARLCIRGDLEANKHLIPSSSPTVNKISLKLMLTLAASKGYQVQCNDVARAFLQTVDLDRDVYVHAPPEAQLPEGKVWKLKRSVYGLIDASRAFFLRYAKGLKEEGFHAIKHDNATFVKSNDKGETEMVTAIHVDDSISVSDDSNLDKHHNKMKQKFQYGSSDSLPTRYLGMNLPRNADGDIVIDQDHYVQGLEIPDISGLQGIKRDETLNDSFQTMFRSLASKLNMLSISSRPDFAIQAKLLTTKYGSATKRDLLTAIKLLKLAKQEPTKFVIPNLGNVEDWLLVGISDASYKTSAQNLAIAGHIIMLVNKHSGAASVLHWSSQKINRRISSSLAAETMALQKLSENLYFVKQLMTEIVGPAAENVPGLAITDNHDLYTCIHNLTSCEDKRLLDNILQIREAIHEDKVITEVRFCPSKENLADCLTKISRKTSQDLMTTLRTGSYTIPGGSTIRDSTQLSIKTWQQLVTAEKESENEVQMLSNPDVIQETQSSALPRSSSIYLQQRSRSKMTSNLQPGPIHQDPTFD